MQKFKDNTGREWSIALNGWQLKRLKSDIDFDARDPESIQRAANDGALLCNVLFVLCEDQAKRDGVSDQQFGEAMSGDAIDAAAEAYIAESIDFFPQRQRTALKTMLAKVNEYQTRATALATEKLTSPQMDQLIQKTLAESSQKIDDLLAGTTIGNSSGKSLA